MSSGLIAVQQALARREEKRLRQLKKSLQQKTLLHKARRDVCTRFTRLNGGMVRTYADKFADVVMDAEQQVADVVARSEQVARELESLRRLKSLDADDARVEEEAMATKPAEENKDHAIGTGSGSIPTTDEGRGPSKSKLSSAIATAASATSSTRWRSKGALSRQDSPLKAIGGAKTETRQPSASTASLSKKSTSAFRSTSPAAFLQTRLPFRESLPNRRSSFFSRYRDAQQKVNEYYVSGEQPLDAEMLMPSDPPPAPNTRRKFIFHSMECNPVWDASSKRLCKQRDAEVGTLRALAEALVASGNWEGEIVHGAGRQRKVAERFSCAKSGSHKGHWQQNNQVQSEVTSSSSDMVHFRCGLRRTDIDALPADLPFFVEADGLPHFQVFNYMPFACAQLTTKSGLTRNLMHFVDLHRLRLGHELGIFARRGPPLLPKPEEELNFLDEEGQNDGLKANKEKEVGSIVVAKPEDMQSQNSDFQKTNASFTAARPEARADFLARICGDPDFRVGFPVSFDLSHTDARDRFRRSFQKQQVRALVFSALHCYKATSNEAEANTLEEKFGTPDYSPPRPKVSYPRLRLALKLFLKPKLDISAKEWKILSTEALKLHKVVLNTRSPSKACGELTQDKAVDDEKQKGAASPVLQQAESKSSPLTPISLKQLRELLESDDFSDVLRLDESGCWTGLDGPENLWIVKPANAGRGEGIRVENRLENCMRMSSGIVQKYIEQPHLIEGRKFDMRQWLVLTSCGNTAASSSATKQMTCQKGEDRVDTTKRNDSDDHDMQERQKIEGRLAKIDEDEDQDQIRAWFYDDCYLRLAGRAYSTDTADKFVHLTNNCIVRHTPDLEDYEATMWHSDRYAKFLEDEVANPRRVAWSSLQDQMKTIARLTLECTKSTIADRTHSYELFGYDFMVDAFGKVWLLEVNSSPDLSHSTNITAGLTRAMAQDLGKLIFEHEKLGLMDAVSLRRQTTKEKSADDGILGRFSRL
ncbi:unnamed protein product [Amoebophrya sp. A25]|nr:unnamed protein product [Amoebophrya sp. A25]|eukprot:GSA25T00005257001.1